MSSFTYKLHLEVHIAGATFVHPHHDRAGELGWAVLRRWSDDSKRMSFMAVKGVLCREDYAGREHGLLYGQLHSSTTAVSTGSSSAAAQAAAQAAEVRLDPVIVMPVFCDVANKHKGVTVAVRIPFSQVAAGNFSVVEHLGNLSLLVALARDPNSLHLAVGLPLPQ